MCNPSAVVHSASAATGSCGLVGAGGCRLPMVGDSGALLWKSPGSSLAYVQPAETMHAAARTTTSRFTAATLQYYGRRFSGAPRKARARKRLYKSISRRLLVIGERCDGLH